MEKEYLDNLTVKPHGKKANKFLNKFEGLNS